MPEKLNLNDLRLMAEDRKLHIEMLDDGYCCSCHENPPCSFCECEVSDDDWADATDPPAVLRLLDLLEEARGIVQSHVSSCGGCDDGVPLYCDDEECGCWELHTCTPARAWLAKAGG